MLTIYIALACFCVSALRMGRTRIGFPSSHSLLPFQRGVLYRDGYPSREEGPGRHRVFLGREKIIFLDSRPIDVKIPFRTVRLADGSTAVFGFAATCEIQDVHRVIYSSATYTVVPMFVTLCVARDILNGCRKAQIETAGLDLTDKIAEACRSRLAASGFALTSFRFTRLEMMNTAPLIK